MKAALLFVAVLACPACSMLKVVGSTLAGAAAGWPLGPGGIVVGAAAGAGGGHLWAENGDLQDRLDKAEAAAQAARDSRDQLVARIGDLDRRLSAIQGAPPSDPKLPPLIYGPPMPPPTGPWIYKTPFETVRDLIGGDK